MSASKFLRITLFVIPDAQSAIRNPGANTLPLCHPLDSGFSASLSPGMTSFADHLPLQGVHRLTNRNHTGAQSPSLFASYRVVT